MSRYTHHKVAGKPDELIELDLILALFTLLLSIGGLRVDKHRSVQCVGFTMFTVRSLRVAVVNARQAVLRLTQLLGLAHARMHA